MIALLGLLQTVQVVLQGGLRLPCRPVDPLQLRAPLVPSPVRGGHLGQLEVTQPSCGRHVRAPAKVHESGGVAVGANRTCADPFGGVIGAGTDTLDDLHLVRLVGEDLEALDDSVLFADERLVLADYLLHPPLDPHQVVLAEVRPAREIEIVIEAVLDRRSYRVASARPQISDGLGQDMGRRVTQHRVGRLRWTPRRSRRGSRSESERRDPESRLRSRPRPRLSPDPARSTPRDPHRWPRRPAPVRFRRVTGL